MKSLAQEHTPAEVEELGFGLLLSSYYELSSEVRKYLRVQGAVSLE